MFDPAGASPGLLAKGDTRIVVIDTGEAIGGAEQASIADLPARIVQGSAHLRAGTPDTSAVTTVRRAAHHVSAIFAEDTDGALLGHMCFHIQRKDGAPRRIRLFPR